MPRADCLEVWALICCLREKRLEVINSKQYGYSVMRLWSSITKQKRLNEPCLFFKTFEQRRQNSRCRGPIFQTNIDQLEKRGALRER